MAEEMMLDMVEVVVSITVEILTIITMIVMSTMIVGLTEVTDLIMNLHKIRMSVASMLLVIKNPQPVQQDGVVQTILLHQVIVCGTNPLMYLKVQLCLKEKGTPRLVLIHQQ